MNEATNIHEQLTQTGQALELDANRVETIASRYATAADIIAAEYETAMSIEVTDPTDKALMLQARKLRLHLRGYRVQLDKDRAELGADALKEKQAVDRMAKLLRDSYEVAEAHLLQQEKYADRLEAKRRAEIAAERLEILAGFDFPTSGVNLAEMSDDEFKLMRDRAEQAFEAEKRRVAEEAAEKERLAADAAAAREKQREAERDAAAEKQKAIDAQKEVDRLEREKREAERKRDLEAAESDLRKSALKNGSDAEKLRELAEAVANWLESEEYTGLVFESSEGAAACGSFVQAIKNAVYSVHSAADRFAANAKLAAGLEKKIEGNCPDCGFEMADGNCTNEYCPEPF